MNAMTESEVARCQGCGKVYRVPDRHRTYTCRTCGEALVLDEAPAAGTVTCAECEAIQPAGTRFCVECGTSLDVVQPKHGEVVARLRHEANEDLRRATHWIDGMTLVYRAGAVAYAIAAVFAMLALAREDVPTTPGMVVVGLTTLLSILLGMGAMHAPYRPVLWTGIIAALATAVSVVHVLGPNPFGVAGLASAVWALAAWGALLPTVRIQQLIEKHKDQYVLHLTDLQTRRSLERRTARERHERLLGILRSRSSRAWRASAAAAAAVALTSMVGTQVVMAKLRPTPFDPARAAFEQAWAAADQASIAGAMDPEVRDVLGPWLLGRMEGHGWKRATPPLTHATERLDGQRVVLAYRAADVPLSTTWQRTGSKWWIVGATLPVPALEPTVEAFVKAWQDSDPPGLANHYSEDSRMQMLSSIRTAVANRGWTDFPRVVDQQITDYSEGKSTVTLILDDKELVSTQWQLTVDGTWRLFSLRFPDYTVR